MIASSCTTFSVAIGFVQDCRDDHSSTWSSHARALHTTTGSTSFNDNSLDGGKFLEGCFGRIWLVAIRDYATSITHQMRLL